MPNPMNLTIPTPSVTAGPLYATQVSNDLEIIASHTHTGSANNDGDQVPSAGLNINDDVSFQSNNATTLRSARFADQSQVLAGIGDIGCIYEKSGDLWYNNSDGTPVQITSGSSLIAPVGGYTTTTTSINLTINPSATTILVSCNSTSGPILITLPLASSVAAGRFYIIKDTNGTSATNNITVTPNGSNTIDLSTDSQIIRNDFGSLCIVSDGSDNWLLFNYAGATTPRLSSTSTITIPDITSDAIYILSVASNSITVNLPSLSNIAPGIKIWIKDNGSAEASGNTISIVPDGVNFIEGLNATKTIITAYGEICLVASSAGWYML